MQYILENERFRAAVHSQGAELCSLFDKQCQREYIWQGNPAIWAGHSPLLFPVVGKLKEDAYRVNGKKYTMPKHGFAKTSEFTLADKTPLSLTLRLKESPATRACYPYAFVLDVCFALEDNCLQITHTVHNPASADMLLFSIGAHPAFCCELGDRLIFEHAESPTSRRLNDAFLLDERSFPVPFTGNALPLTADLFARDALILVHPLSCFVTLESATHGDLLRVHYFDAPVLGLWAKPGAPYVCIEPWYGIDDSSSATGELSGKPEIVALPPGETFLFPVHITLLA